RTGRRQRLPGGRARGRAGPAEIARHFLAAGRHQPRQRRPGLAATARSRHLAGRPVGGDRVSTHAMDGSDLVMPRLIVPAYFHPASHPAEWAWLAGQAEQVRLVVLNLADGPGSAPDAVVRPAVGRLHAAGVPVAGYVDTNYGLRPPREALADLGRYLDW